MPPWPQNSASPHQRLASSQPEWREGDEAADAKDLLFLWEEGKLLRMPRCGGDRREGGNAETGSQFPALFPRPRGQRAAKRALCWEHSGGEARRPAVLQGCPAGWEKARNREVFLPRFFNGRSVSHAACERSGSRPLRDGGPEARGTRCPAKSDAECNQRAATAFLPQTLGRTDQLAGFELRWTHFPSLSPLTKHEAGLKHTPRSVNTAQLIGEFGLIQIFGLHIDKILHETAAPSGS